MEGALSACRVGRVAGEPAALSVVALLCRTSDRIPEGADGARSLAEEIAGRAGTTARMIGSPEPVHDGRWDEDLTAARGCLLEAGGQISDALRAGERPVLTAADCSIAMTTLRELERERPGAVVLWLGAHADFHSPQSSASGYLGGMCLAAACGVWEPGLTGADPIAPEQVVMAGVRDVDPGELPQLDRGAISRADGTDAVIDRVAGREVFVHLDLDVLDPGVMPGVAFPAADGLDAEDLADLFEAVAEESRSVIGMEITGLGVPDRAGLVADIVAPLLATNLT